MEALKERPVAYYALPLPAETVLLHVEQVVLKFRPLQSIDFGALCYIRRGVGKRIAGAGRKVDLSSFSQVRAGEIRRVIEIVSETFGGGQLRPNAVLTRYRIWAKFMDWCDANNHSGVLTDHANARAALRAWAVEVRRRVDQHHLSQNSGAMEQKQVALVLEDFFEVEDMTAGMNLLSQARNLTRPTTVPDDRAQAMVLAWCTCIFDGFSNLVLKRRDDGTPEPFPFALTVPKFLEYPDNCMWVFPSTGWGPSAAWGHAYDKQNGRIREVEEIKHLYRQRKDAEQAVQRARVALAKANASDNHPARLRRGSLACQAFHLLFIAVTGANAAPAADLLWSEEMEASVERPEIVRQGIRMVKYRAHGEVQQFEIGVEYLPYLRRYLQLRKRLLAGKPWDYLFFTYAHNSPGSIARFQPLQAYGLYRVLRQYSPDLPQIVPRQWRAAKQDYAIRQGDPVLAASIMQQSVETTIKYYSNGTVSVHQEEMSAYLGWVEKKKDAVLDQGLPVAAVRSAGSCASPNEPKAFINNPPIQPDCTRGEGCLFCDRFRIHADENDSRKLLGARHCIRVAAKHAASVEEHDRAFGPILQAIEFYLDLIRERDSDLVARVEKEVDIEGELDAFWAAKLSTLIELGMDS